nr:ethanolamine utilization microcompartment protein EutL [uncultured Acetobacterium sp.]
MTGDSLKAKVISAKLLTAVEEIMIKKFELPENHSDIGIFTTETDEAGYVAIDEATKEANITAAYARSSYGGVGCENGGQMLGVISGTSIDDVKAGLNYIVDFISRKSGLYSANEDGSITYFAQTIASIGSYFSNRLNLPKGTAIAYVAAPPLEGIIGVDEVLRTTEVTVVEFWDTPTTTNRSGAIFTGTSSDCDAACRTFAQAVIKSVKKQVDI